MLDDAAIARLRAAATWPQFTGDRYDVLEEIARGGMGTVYLASDRELGRTVAIKVPNGVQGAEIERRLQREVHVLANLEHPGVVPIHDTGRLADGRLFYVMKHVRGRTLSEHLADVPDLAERLRLFERICEPVAFAHAQGVIHRDLKPENVMVGAFGEVLVMDWGVAKRLADPSNDADEAAGAAHDGGTQIGTVIGTRGYMAPEQADGSHAADARADVYSLGAILVLLLTGTPPPPDDPSESISGRRDVPKPLRAICARCLAPDPASRYASVTALSQDVARFLAGHAVEAHPESMVEQAGRLFRTYRTAILLVLAYIVMRVAVAITAGW